MSSVPSQIFLETELTSASFVKVGGHCYQLVGDSTVAANITSVDDTYTDCLTCLGETTCSGCDSPDYQSTQTLADVTVAGPDMFGIAAGAGSPPNYLNVLVLYSGGDGYVGGGYEPGCYRLVYNGTGAWFQPPTWDYNAYMYYNDGASYADLGFPTGFANQAAVEAYVAANPTAANGPIVRHTGGAIGVFTGGYIGGTPGTMNGSPNPGYDLQKCDDPT